MSELMTMCTITPPEFWGLFNFSGVPKLLLYSYIPATLTLFLIWGTFFRQKRDDFSLSWFLFAFFLLLFFTNEVLHWTLVSNFAIYVAWHLSFFLEMGVYVSMLAVLVSTYQGGVITAKQSYGMAGIMLLVAALSPTALNVAGYDFASCEGVDGVLWNVGYVFEGVVLVGLLVFLSGLFYKYIKSQDDQYRQDISEPILVVSALLLFLVPFAVLGYVEDVTKEFSLGRYKGVGLLLFIAHTLYTMIRNNVYKTKIAPAHAPVILQCLVVFALLFVADPVIQSFLKLATILIVLVMGYFAYQAISSEQKIRSELESKNQELLELNQAKTEFLSFANHQLKAPLTALKWGLGELNDYANSEAEGVVKATPQERAGLTSRLVLTVNQMIRTVNDFLNASKIETNELVLSSEPLDISQLIHEAVTELVPVAEMKSLHLSYIGDDKVVLCDLDKTKIEQVLLILIDNAIKYTDTGSVTVSLEQLDGMAQIEVRDTGAGMSTEEISGLFHRYARGKAASKNSSGSGIGLYLAKEIVNLHAGNLSVSSAGEGKGSTFVLKLPSIQY